MNFLLISAFGIAAASAAGMPASGYLRSVDERSVADVDVKTLWDQLAAEAQLMQVMIAEDRTTADCKDNCNDCSDCNRARCRRDCDKINDEGNNSNTRTMSCTDCRATFRSGSNKLRRCLNACQDAQDRCVDAEDCDDCRSQCTGNAVNRCLDANGCSSGDNDDNEDYDYGAFASVGDFCDKQMNHKGMECAVCDTDEEEGNKYEQFCDECCDSWTSADVVGRMQ